MGGGQKKRNNLVFWGISLGFLLTPAAYNLFANNPGISSPDTLSSMITNAQHLRGMVDWHPAFYCMVLRAIETIWNSTYAVIIVQYFFWAYVMLELIMYLRKKGVKDYLLLIINAFSGMNAANFLHLNTIWKDVPYTLSLLWTFIIMAKLAIDFGEYKRKWYIYVELIISLIGVFFYRKNGVISFIMIVGVLVIFLKENKKLMVSLVLSIVMIGLIRGPVYSYFEVKESGMRGIYHGLGQDILGVYYSGGEVSEETLQMINMMTNYNVAEYSYTPTWSNQSYDVEVKPINFIKNYINTFLQNPIIMMRAMIDREDAIWDIYAGQDSVLGCVNYTETQDGADGWNTYYNERIYRSLYTRMSAATAYTANTQWMSAIVWRAGLFSLLGLVAIVYMIIIVGKGKYLVILMPSVGHMMSLFLSTGWSDFRYFWPLNLLNMCLVLFSIVIVEGNIKVEASSSKKGNSQLTEEVE